MVLPTFFGCCGYVFGGFIALMCSGTSGKLQEVKYVNRVTLLTAPFFSLVGVSVGQILYRLAVGNFASISVPLSLVGVAGTHTWITLVLLSAGRC